MYVFIYGRCEIYIIDITNAKITNEIDQRLVGDATRSPKTRLVGQRRSSEEKGGGGKNFTHKIPRLKNTRKIPRPPQSRACWRRGRILRLTDVWPRLEVGMQPSCAI